MSTPGVKISALPEIVAPALTDVFPVVQGGVTYKETCTQLAALIATATGFVSYTPPIVAGQIAVFTNTTGNLSSGTGTIVNPGGSIQAGLSGTSGCFIAYPSVAASGTLSLCAVTNSAGDFSTTVSNNSTVGQNQVIYIPDAGAGTANFVINSSLTGQLVTTTSASATPTINSLATLLTLSATTLTGAQGYGIVGHVNMVGASAGGYAGVDGTLVATGILSGSTQATGVYGNITLTGGTINGALVSPVLSAYLGTSPTTTDVSKTSGFAHVNGTTMVLNSVISAVTDATYLMNLQNVSTYFATAGVSSGSWGNGTPPTPSKVLAIRVGSTTYYLPLVAQNT